MARTTSLLSNQASSRATATLRRNMTRRGQAVFWPIYVFGAAGAHPCTACPNPATQPQSVPS